MRIKTCEKCNFSRKTDDKVCGVLECNGNLKFWVSSNRDLINSFVTECNIAGWGDLGPKIKEIEETNFNKLHEGIKIDSILSRIKTTELLHTDATHEPLIDAGFNVETSLRIYLATTCFDMLGQTEEFLPFNSWLNLKNRKSERIKLKYLKMQ